MQWRVRLFDGPRLEGFGGEEVRHFRSRQVGALLSYLALRLGRQCPREELAGTIWPEEFDSQVLSNRLRVALASLRRQLEPSGVPFGTVLDVSTPGRVCLRAESVWCDVIAFEHALKAGQPEVAAELLAGTFLPGYHDEWIDLERERLRALSYGSDLREDPPIRQSLPNQAALPLSPDAVDRQPFLSLPLYLTRFFGRSEELVHLGSLLEEHRLVTITGPGGIGKTRLAVEVARQLPRRCVFVSLAEVTDPKRIPEAVLRAFKVSPSTEADLSELLFAYLRGQGEATLILDNAEQIVEAVALFTINLLEATPATSLLVTSRRRLEIGGEAFLALNPLQNPSLPTKWSEPSRLPALDLFLDRARNARPDFTITSKNSQSVVEICCLLEGMPLALELAAARVTSQSPSQIEVALKDSLIHLESHQRSLSPRHRSLNAAIQGSYELLDEELQAFFSQLSVFHDGWTSDAARYVTDCPKWESSLEELEIRSLVIVAEDEKSDALRFHFLESIRQFAGEQLDDSKKPELWSRHSEYFLRLASLVTDENVASLLPLDAEQENLRVALERGPNLKGGSFWSGLAGSLTYGHIRGKHRSYLPWAEFALATVSEIPDVETRVRLRYASYYVFSYLGRVEVIESIGQAMFADSLENRFIPGQVKAMLVLGYAAGQREELIEALRICQDALEISRASGDSSLEWQSLRIVGFILNRLHTWKLAAGEDSSSFQAASENALRECLGLLSGSSSHIAFTELTLAYVLASQGRSEEGYAHLKIAQRTALQQGMASMLVFAFREESMLATVAGDFEYGAVLRGAFLQLRAQTGYNSFDGENSADRAALDLIAELGESRYQALLVIGRRTPLLELAAMSIGSHPNL